ncbi:hypothetical protein Glove_120g159 [Diversispora epigaea]|uniref:Uncharacterized protein n=1 Tax=Diversispora epigaea TaxID=1348612 RepID=A0A397J8M5_9GLOM|nr:hypothetical protein Glove_120g159 [Diversispora epigaea]
MSTNIITHLQNEVRDGVIRLQHEAKNAFEKETEKVKEKIETLSEDQVEDFVRNKFQNLNEMFLKHSKTIEELVISKKPKKPVKNPNETEEEFMKKYKAYEANFDSYKDFVTWSMTVVNRLMFWISDLFDDIIAFFKKLWTWIMSKMRDMSKNIREFIERVAMKFSQLYEYLFEK